MKQTKFTSIKRTLMLAQQRANNTGKTHIVYEHTRLKKFGIRKVIKESDPLKTIRPEEIYIGLFFPKTKTTTH